MQEDPEVPETPPDQGGSSEPQPKDDKKGKKDHEKKEGHGKD